MSRNTWVKNINENKLVKTLFEIMASNENINAKIEYENTCCIECENYIHIKNVGVVTHSGPHKEIKENSQFLC